MDVVDILTNSRHYLPARGGEEQRVRIDRGRVSGPVAKVKARVGRRSSAGVSGMKPAELASILRAVPGKQNLKPNSTSNNETACVLWSPRCLIPGKQSREHKLTTARSLSVHEKLDKMLVLLVCRLSSIISGEHSTPSGRLPSQHASKVLCPWRKHGPSTLPC